MNAFVFIGRSHHDTANYYLIFVCIVHILKFLATFLLVISYITLYD